MAAQSTQRSPSVYTDGRLLSICIRKTQTEDPWKSNQKPRKTKKKKKEKQLPSEEKGKETKREENSKNSNFTPEKFLTKVL
jgi:hypothetical protein